MSKTRVVLVDDARAASLGPLASTRPVFDIRFGIVTQLERYLRSPYHEVVGLRVRRELRDLVAERHPDLPIDPPTHAADYEIDARIYDLGPLHGGQRFLERPWQIVDVNGAAIAADVRLEIDSSRRADLPPTAVVIGPSEDVFVDPSATVNPYVVFDTTDGPIFVGPDALIDSFTKIEGPAAVCEGARLFRALVRPGTTIGPYCRVGGEIEATIFQGYSNKYHEGFLGHAFVGEWCNLGAGTTNSDLRNDYGEVHVPMADGDRVEKVATGTNKAGVYLGDHVKTAIGSLFNTGTCVGEGAVVAPGGGLMPKFVPPFARLWHGRVDDGLDLDGVIATAKTATGRRGRELSPAAENLLRLRQWQTRDLRANFIASRKPEA